MREINENLCLRHFKNIVHKENYRDYLIFVVEINLDIPLPFFDLSENSTWYNGYIVIPNDCKYHDMDYDDINYEIDIHEGFTFSNFIENEYVIGFDTNHASDDERTQNVDFVLKELKNAVDQIIEKEKEEFLKNVGRN